MAFKKFLGLISGYQTEQMNKALSGVMDSATANLDEENEWPVDLEEPK